MHDVSLSDKYEELVKESQSMHRDLQRLENELEATKEALRKKEEGADRSIVVADAESNDMWSRLGSGNMVCYAPVAALSYWRRWRGRPDDVHTS